MNEIYDSAVSCLVRVPRIGGDSCFLDDYSVINSWGLSRRVSRDSYKFIWFLYLRSLLMEFFFAGFFALCVVVPILAWLGHQFVIHLWHCAAIGFITGAALGLFLRVLFDLAEPQQTDVSLALGLIAGISMSLPASVAYYYPSRLPKCA